MVGFLEAIRRGWRVLLLVAVPLFAGVVAYTETLPDQFDSTAVVSFAPRPETDVGADVVRIVLPKYQVYAESEQTIARVARQLGVDPAEIEDSIDVAIPLETSNVQISVSNQSPRFTSRVTNAVAAEVVDFSDDDPLLEAALVARAIPPTEPSGPPRRLLEIAGAIGALLAGIGVMLLVDRLRPVVRTLADVAETTGLRVVGVLPRVSAMRNKPVEALSNRRVGPAIRNLRTQLERHVERDSDDGRGLVIAFTSSSEGEGKSSIAAVYAVASARMQQRVLLIDGDLLRPDVAELFRIAPKPGVAQVLKGAQSVDAMQYLRDPGVPNLSVMPTSRDPDGGDLVARNMGDLLRWASSAFDLVVVDSPPVLGNDIGPTIATLADAVVFVLRRGTRGSLADDAVGVLRTLEANVVGAVANAVPPSDAAYYG